MTAKPTTATYSSSDNGSALDLLQQHAADPHPTSALAFTKTVSRCRSRLNSRLYLRTTCVSQAPPMHRYAVCASFQFRTRPFTLLRTDSQCPDSHCIYNSLELCTQFFQQQIKESSLEAPATCTPTYTITFTTGCHACTQFGNQIRTRPKSYE